MSELSPIGNLEPEDSDDPEPSGPFLYVLPPLESGDTLSEQLVESEMLAGIVSSIDTLIGAGDAAPGRVTNYLIHQELVAHTDKGELRLRKYKKFEATSKDPGVQLYRAMYGSHVAKITFREFESEQVYYEDGAPIKEEVYSYHEYLIKRDENGGLEIFNVAAGDESMEPGGEKLPAIYDRVNELAAPHFESLEQ